MIELYRRHMGNMKDRTTNTNKAAFSINALTGTGQLIIGIVFFSPWFIVNSIYYLLLCIARGQALRSSSRLTPTENKKERYDTEFAVYKKGGIFICLLGISYLAICLWMFFTGESRVHSGTIMSIIVATIAFTKISVAIRGMIVCRRMNNPVISLFKKISFLDAMVAMVVTQCTLLSMSNSAEAVSSSAIFGIGVSILFLVLGILTLIKKKKYPEDNLQNPKGKKGKKISIRKVILIGMKNNKKSMNKLNDCSS